MGMMRYRAEKDHLIAELGTAKAVSRAAMADLMAVGGISESVARIVYNHFHDDAAG